MYMPKYLSKSVNHVTIKLCPGYRYNASCLYSTDAASCPKIQLEHGKVEYHEVPRLDHTYVTIECEKYADLVPPDSRYLACLDDKTWSDPVPVCRRKTKIFILDNERIENGSLNVWGLSWNKVENGTNQRQGTKIRQSCTGRYELYKDGYLNTNYFESTSIDGHWIPRLATCKKKRCHVSTIDNGTPKLSDGSGAEGRKVEHGVMVTTVCDDQFELDLKHNNNVISECGLGQLGQLRLKTCSPKRCDVPEKRDNTLYKFSRRTLDGGKINHGAPLSVTCSNKDECELVLEKRIGTKSYMNMNMHMKTFNAECQYGGYKPHDIPHCEERRCDVLHLEGDVYKNREPIMNRYMTSGDSISVECAHGYRFQGNTEQQHPVKVTCNKGQLDGFVSCEPDEEPYQMDAPVRIQANAMSEDAVHLTWQDPSLGADQLIRDGRYYTVRYHSFSLGQYNYVNVTDLRSNVNGLRSNTEYEFAVRVNNPPYLSEWSEGAKNRTRQIVIVKAGQCPAVPDDAAGICVEECQSDNNCDGNQKCCSNSCGRICVYPDGFDICSLETDPGSCAKWEVRWFYDSTEQRCDIFWYGGCNDGNANNFKTEDECKLRCIGALPVTTEAPFDCSRTRFGCCADGFTAARDAERSDCPVIVKAGQCPAVREDAVGICVQECQNDNNCDGNQKCCSNGCGRTCIYPDGFDICSLETDTGSCANWEVRWFYDSTEQRCDRFLYGGCNDGNENNFKTEDECKLRCIGALPENRQQRETIVAATPGESVIIDCRYGANVTWYRDGKLLESNNRLRLNPDGTIEVFTATIEDDGVYACHVGEFGRATVYRYVLQVRMPIGILPGPDQIMVKPNRKAFLHCEVYGNPRPAVTWQRYGSDVQSNNDHKTFPNGTLLIYKAQEADKGQYTCIADNSVSASASRTLELLLREMLVARIENENGRVIEGSRITISCVGRGYPQPTVTWEKMGRPLESGGNVYISNTGRLVIRDVTTDDSGVYACIVANEMEKIETSTSVQVVPKSTPDKCEDKTSLMKCRLIVTMRFCGYTMYSEICCNSCLNSFVTL